MLEWYFEVGGCFVDVLIDFGMVGEKCIVCVIEEVFGILLVNLLVV